MSMTPRRFGSGSGRPGETTPHPSAQGGDPLPQAEGKRVRFAPPTRGLAPTATHVVPLRGLFPPERPRPWEALDTLRTA